MKFWRQRKDEELDAEIRSHLDEAIRDRIARGETPDDARAHALREFGNVGLVKEVTREMWGWASLERLMQDLRFGLRMLRKNPGFSFIAILTLALGIGMNVAVFSVVNAVLLKPLPFPEPERLVSIQNQFLARNLKNAGVSAADYADYRGRRHIFEEVAAGSSVSFNLTGVERAETVPGVMVTAGLFPLLGVKPVTGRVFTAEEDQPGRQQVAVLSAGFWRRRFGGDPQVVGRTLQLNEQSSTVVGVIPAALEFLGAAEIFTPAAFTAEQMNPERRSARSLFALARLKHGVSLAQAQSEMNAFAKSLAAEFPNDYPAESGWGVPRFGARALGGRSATDALGVVGDGGICPVDRLRQCRESVAGARHRAGAGDFDSRRARRFRGATGASTADRNRAARIAGRRCRIVAGGLGDRAAGADCAGEFSAPQ
jgi:hypothetical protein